MNTKLISLLSTLLLTALAIMPARADVLNLDGSGDYVTFPATGIPSGSASFTIEAWINPTTIPTGGEDGGQMTFWGNESGNQANGFRLRGASGLRHFFWGNDHDENLTMNILPDTTGPSMNGWHHLALVWNGTQTRWYWNGAAIGNPRNSVGVNVVAANHRIGARPGGEFFHGFMDEVRVWSVARSAAEISANFQRELIGDEAGLVAYWNFEGNLTDRAGGNNNGTAVGNAVTTAGLNAPVLPVGPRIYSFSASTNQIYLGQSFTLSWALSNAMSVVINNGIGAVTLTNSIVLTPSVTTTYTLTATNLIGVSTATTTVTVDPGIPLASNFSTNTPYNTPVAITLRGSDPQGSNLTYSIVGQPPNGSLSGTPPNVTYTPSNNFGGLDSFTFKVNDGAFDSAPATVSINVVPPPLPPSAIVLGTTNIPSAAGPGAFIAALQAIDVNNLYGDSHTFGLVAGYGDNAKFAVSGSSLLAGPAFTGGPGAVFSLRLRATDSTSLSYTQDVTLVVFDAPRSVVINEVHYNPDFNPVRESFIELYNDTDAPIDISQWRVSGGVDFFFPAGTTLGARAFAIVAESPAEILSRYGKTAFGPWIGGLNNNGEQLTLRDANSVKIDEVDYRNEFPWPIAADGDGPSAQLVNASLDNDLGSSWRSAPATPGATNPVFSTNAAPNLRQVDHSPNSPRSTNQVTVTCKVTDPNGVASVALAYQVVAPGAFIPATLPLSTAQLNNLNNVPMTNALNPAFELPANWTTVAMHDDGVNGDEVAGDGIYSVLLPPQAHRTLVRYRITCTDTLGASRRAPFEDDASLNFAYWVYNGIPAYQGFQSAALDSLPMYTLITRDADLNQCTAWFNGADRLTTQIINGMKNEGRFHFNWEGAMVYDGQVYDHITYRLRGANGRYHDGKRSIRYKFKQGRYLAAKDTLGKRFPTKWPELTTGKGQSNRGSETYALQEVVNYFLWNKVGVPAPNTLHFHFRVVRGASEAGADQYSGDFWGLNWAQEKYDASFLESHNLPRGNLYKLIDNLSASLDEQRYQGAFAVTNGADLFNVENNLTGFQSASWLLAHANYTNWFRYFTVAEAIRHYDTWPSANKNGAYYFEPLYGASNSFLGRMMQLPYDGTDTWGPTWNSGEDILHNGIFNDGGVTGGDSGENPELQKEYRNTVRELRTLLFQPDQIGSVIDAFAGPLKSVAAADLVRWSNAPAPARYLSLAFPASPGVVSGLPGVAQDMKNFMFNGGNNPWWIDRTTIGAGGWITRLDTVATDVAIPTRPTITYVGTNGYPVDGLIFQSSAFADPQGAGTFGSMQWRLAEVLLTNTVVTNLSQVRLEWDAAWISPELTAFNGFYTMPEFAVQPDRFYRARVRHKDNTGRWSQWSLPIEFRPSPRDTISQLRTNLVFSEVMYNPPGDGVNDGDEFEFVELKNIGPFTLNLSGLFFSQGITFGFTNGTTLAPGATFLLARNPGVLVSRHPGLVVNGDYSDKLNNDGETISISHPVAGEVISLTYSDRAPWPVTTDGLGFSLVRDPASGSYRASAARFGTPGADGGLSTVGGVVINEVLSSSTLPLKDFIELLNVSGATVDVSGWFLTDDPTLPQKFRIPNRPALAPGEFAVFTENDFNPTPGLGTSFSLSSFGDDAYLFSADGIAQLTGYSHGLNFSAAQDGVSFGRYINSIGEEQFPLQISLTSGGVNSGPRVGPLVISEIHYNPRNNADEFVEVRNLTGAPVMMFDPAAPTNTWKLNGVGFTFPTNFTLDANSSVLLVLDTPATFRARFGVPAHISIFQYAGNLQDSGELLELQAPDLPTTNGVPYYAVDAVRYNDKQPWPLAADGAGASLQRINPGAYGNDPINWLAASPTPGTHGVSGTPPAITSQPSSQNGLCGQSVMFSVSASGSGPLSYQWLFKEDNIAGATNSILMLSGLSYDKAGPYSVVVFNSAGSAQSSNATLNILIPATFTQQPVDVDVRVRPDLQSDVAPVTNVTFSISVNSANPPVSYQWRLNGTNITSANIFGINTATLLVSNVTVDSFGAYSCAVTDGNGTLSSAPAMLIPLVRPLVAVGPPTPLAVPAGQPVPVSVVLSNGFPPPFGYQWRSNSIAIATPVSNSKTNFFVIPATFVPTNAVTSTYRVIVTNRAATSFQVAQSATFSVNTLLDTDRDGIPDSTEIALGLMTNNAADALLDLDGDGVSNVAEYQAGTNPNDSNSYLRVAITASNNLAQLTVAAVSNRTYSVQYSDALPASWNKLADLIARATNRVELLVDPTWTTNRFYRAVLPAQ
jgi:Concanavalin A-like lectin/glucanases superfamily/Lamin Tail Domain/Bacterial Ig domain/CotH kinase protein